MRLPSLILLASAALALTVQAQESNIVDVVVQVNGEIQAQEPHSPVPEVTAPRREGKDYEPQHAGPAIPEATAPRSRRKSIAVQADDASPADPEVTAPRPGRGVQTDTVGPALPGATAPIQAGKAVAAKVVISAIAVDEDEVDEDGGKRGNGRKGRSESKGKVKGDARAKGKGEEELWEEPTRTTDPEAEAVPEPEVTAPRSPGHGFQAQAHFARPAVPAITAPRELGKSIKKTIKVKVLCRGGDVVKAGATVPGPEVTAPAPQVTAPVMEAEGVLIPSEAGSHIDAVQVRVNGKVVADGEEGLAIAQVNSPGPDDTAPAPKAAIAAPPDPSKHIAETKFIHQKNALGGRSSASETKPSGLLNGLLDGLLGIGLGGKKKKSKGPPTDDDEKDWDHLRLYGDDGYVPRPLPIQPNGEPNCEVLAFRDQMIWDQQGDHGRHVNVPNPNTEKAPEEGAYKTETVAKPVDAGADAPPSSSSTDEIKDDENITDIKDKKGTVHPSGIHICLLGPCDDDDTNDEDTRIDHIQKKFLRQFKGKALRIDSRTGCPLPSDKLTR